MLFICVPVSCLHVRLQDRSNGGLCGSLLTNLATVRCIPVIFDGVLSSAWQLSSYFAPMAPQDAVPLTQQNLLCSVPVTLLHVWPVHTRMEQLLL